MLHLLLSDGSTRLIPDATTARVDTASEKLICLDERGQEVARFDKLSVTMFSDKPFPSGATLTAPRRPQPE